MQQILAKPQLKSVTLLLYSVIGVIQLRQASERGNYSNTLPVRPLTPMEKLMADIASPHSLKPVQGDTGCSILNDK